MFISTKLSIYKTYSHLDQREVYMFKEQGTLRVIFGLFSEVNKFWSKYSLGHGLSIYSNIIFVSLIVFEIPGKKDDMQNYDVI